MATIDISEFENLWDGSEFGWQLVRHDTPVYLVEFCFGDDGPNEIERRIAAEFYEPIQENGGLLDDCPGFAIAHPISVGQHRKLVDLQSKHQLNLNIVEIVPDDFLVRCPDGNFHSWLVWPGIEYRLPIIRKMLECGVTVVDRHLE